MPGLKWQLLLCIECLHNGKISLLNSNFLIANHALKVCYTQNEFMRTSIFQNSNGDIVRISALKVFIVSLGPPGSFLSLPVGFFIYDITY